MMVSCSRFIWIRNSSDHRKVWIANLLHTKSLPNLLMALWPSGLCNYFACKRFAVQTLLWSLEFVIQINLEHNTIAVWNLGRRWSISCINMLSLKFGHLHLKFWSTMSLIMLIIIKKKRQMDNIKEKIML